MAQTKKTSPAKSSNDKAVVTRVKAVDDKPAAKKPAKQTATKSAKTTAKADTPKKRRGGKAKGPARPFVAMGGYFKGAWHELKEVRWPTRDATWSLTGAVLIYSIAFTVLIVLLDLGFKRLFELAIGK